MALNASAQGSSVYNLRSDSVDILHYQVNLNITDFTTDTIFGNTVATLSPKLASINSVTFDLLRFDVSSVLLNSSPISFSYNDTLLVCYFPSPVNDADTVNVEIFYKGVPPADPTWGGFYFQSGYAYNLGVGFTSIPHNFGRVWHPCFDNFVERATYDFNIVTNGGKVSYCNGYLESETTIGMSVNRHWVLTDPIPSYLACVAVNAYTHVNQKYISAVTGDTTPVMLISVPTDTTNFKNSFINLPVAMDAYEFHYGDYEWDKIGYVAVPFNAGAMEHATCIAYPRTTLTGTTTYQNLMAHELSHHWWGDLVTCETAEDMWINEGMARWSEALFFERLSGYPSYLSNIRNNHKTVVWKAHVNDGGVFYPISGVPQNVTYGSTTYDKGADMIHTLRGYLGDSLFFTGLRTIINDNKFKNINATQFRDQLNAIPGINVTDYFNDWVFQPGFAEFAVDSFQVVPDGSNFDVTVYSKQKWRGGTHLATNVPMTVSLKGNGFSSFSQRVLLSGATQSFTVQDVPFTPQAVFYNENELISEAVTAAQQYITSVGAKSFSNANMNLTVLAVDDSVYARVEQHWVAADSFIVSNPLYVISPDRFWRVHLLGDVADFNSRASMTYNGTNSTSAGFLDNGLMNMLTTGSFNEDSLRLFYRSSPSQDWQIWTNVTFATGTKTDKSGSLTIDSIKAGDFALGIKVSALQIDEKKKAENFSVYPNPANGKFTVELKTANTKNYFIAISDPSGNFIQQRPLQSTKTEIDLGTRAKGTYLVSLIANGKIIDTVKLILN